MSYGISLADAYHQVGVSMRRRSLKEDTRAAGALLRPTQASDAAAR